MKKTLIFPRLHKIPKPPRINFGIFKPVTRIAKKKKKSIDIKKSQDKAEQRPKFKEENHILKENYIYIEQQNSFRNKLKHPNESVIPKPNYLYDKLVSEKLKPNDTEIENDSYSISNYNSEEKKINKNTINKIELFSDYDDESTFLTRKISSSIDKKSKKEKKMKKSETKKKREKRNNVRFINTKDNKEIAEKYLEELINKKINFFEKSFIDENIFNNVNKKIFMKRLLYEIDQKKEEIPLYLYEDDSYFQDLLKEISFNIFVEILEENEYFYNRNQVVLPEIVDYHNYLRDFTNMYNSIGGELYLEELYNDDIYIKNKNIKEEEEKIKENKRIKNIIKNKKLKILSEKFKNYLKNKKPSSTSNIFQKDLKGNESSFDSKSSFKENYLNIISKVLKNKKKFSLKYGNNQIRRNKKISKEQSELITIEKMVGGRLHTAQNKIEVSQNDEDFEINIDKKTIKKPTSILKNSMAKWYNNEYSFLDYPDFYEKPKRKNIIFEEIKGFLGENKINNNSKRNKKSKSVYNKYFQNKFNLYNFLKYNNMYKNKFN